MIEGGGGVERHGAALVVGQGEAEVVDDDVGALGEVVDGLDHLGVGADGGEVEVGAGREVVHDLQHRRALRAGLDALGREGALPGQLGQVAGGLGVGEAGEAVGDDADAHAVAPQAGALAQGGDAQREVALGPGGPAGGDRVGGQGDGADAGQGDQVAQPLRRRGQLRVAEVGPPDLRLHAEGEQRRRRRPRAAQPHRDLDHAAVVEAQGAQGDRVAQGLAAAGQCAGVDARAGRLQPLGLRGQGVEQGRQGRGGLGAGRAPGRQGEPDQQRRQRDGGGRAATAAPERSGQIRRPRR